MDALIRAVGQEVDGVAVRVVPLDRGRALRPPAILERPSARRMVVDMRILPSLWLERIRDDRDPAVLARGARKGRVDGRLPVLRLVLVHVPEALVHCGERLRVRVVPPRVVEPHGVNVALLDVLAKLVAPDPVAVRVAREEEPDAPVVVPEDVGVDAWDVCPLRCGQADVVGRRLEIRRRHEEVDVVVVWIKGIIVDRAVCDGHEGARG